VWAPGWVPLCLTDGFQAAAIALRAHGGEWVQPPRRQATGLAPKPRWRPGPQLLYAPVVQTVRRRRLVRVRPRGVCGTLAALQQVLAAGGGPSTTAFSERVPLTIRPHVAAVGRRGTPRCKGEDGGRQQWAFSQVDENVCLPHARLRVPLPQPLPTQGRGSAKTWRPRPPAMAAGLTDRGWTLREVLLLRVPPGPPPVGV
jgi:hypothetical protein